MNFKYLGVFVLVFILLTPIGTIFHELGHFAVAKALGYKASLHYSSVAWENDFKIDVIERYLKYEYEIKNDLPFKGVEKYKIDVEIINKHDLFILIGGVTQTILFGTLSLFLLLFRIKKRIVIKFHLIDWVLTFIALFWSREIFNLLMGVFLGFNRNNGIYFYGDEARIAKLLNIPIGTLLLPLGIIAIVVIFIIIYLIPRKYKSIYLLGAIIGCPLGYLFWMYLIGPIVLPK
jgi:hypothetical protein